MHINLENYKWDESTERLKDHGQRNKIEVLNLASEAPAGESEAEEPG